jgi:sugar (pentulose or hexulose) kinase
MSSPVVLGNIPKEHCGTVRNKEALLLGLDLGVSIVKATLFRLEGPMVGLEFQEYLTIPQGDRVEVDPEHYWTPVVLS